jgi:hypothetical protein
MYSLLWYTARPSERRVTLPLASSDSGVREQVKSKKDRVLRDTYFVRVKGRRETSEGME